MSRQLNYRRNTDQWQKIIKDHAVSGQSVVSYCPEQKLSEKSFYAWRKRLLKQPTFAKKEFVEVSSLSQNIAAPLRIKTPRGYCVEISPATESSLIKDVIRMLELK